jgi:hypothetical protein
MAITGAAGCAAGASVSLQSTAYGWLQNRHCFSSLHHQGAGAGQLTADAQLLDESHTIPRLPMKTYLRPAHCSIHLARHLLWTGLGQAQGRASGWSGLPTHRQIQQHSSSTQQSILLLETTGGATSLQMGTGDEATSSRSKQPLP